MYKPCWSAKGGIIDMGNGRIVKMNFNHFSSLELVLYSWGILDFISMEDWLQWWPNEWLFWIILYKGILQLLSSRGCVCFPLLKSDLSCDLLWPKECGRSNTAPTPQEVLLFPLFLGSLPLPWKQDQLSILENETSISVFPTAPSWLQLTTRHVSEAILDQPTPMWPSS